MIISVPNVDVAKKGETLVAFEGQYGRPGGSNYFNTFTFATHGIGKNTELAATLFGFSSPGTDNRSIALGFKSVLPWTAGWAKKREVKTGYGFLVPFSFDGRGTGYWAFANIGFRLPVTRTRLTWGPSYGTSQIFGRRTYTNIVGVEHPLTKRWSVVADWYTGTHDLAAAVLAMQYQKRQLTVITGYKVANNTRSGQNAVMCEITYAFGGKHHHNH